LEEASLAYKIHVSVQKASVSVKYLLTQRQQLFLAPMAVLFK